MPPENPVALADGIVSALELRAEHHADIHTWDVSRTRYASLIEEIRLAHEDATESNQSQPSRDGRSMLTLRPSRQVQ